MSDSELIKPEEIQNRIYTIHGLQIMLDKDLAVFYDVKPIRLREQVKRKQHLGGASRSLKSPLLR